MGNGFSLGPGDPKFDSRFVLSLLTNSDLGVK